MKKFFTLTAILFAFQFSLPAQSTFQKVISVQGTPNFISTGVHLCNDGGYLMCGYDGGTNNQGFIIKINAAFQVLWTKNFIDPNTSSLYLFNVGECANGGYYAMGYSTDSAYTTTSCFLVRMDVAGNVLWNHQYDMPPGEFLYGNVAPKVRELSSGDFLINTAMYGSMGVIKTDANGNILFAKSFRGDTTEPKDPGVDAILCNDGGVLAAGKRGNDPYFVKTDAAGNIQWSKIFAVTNFYNRIYRILPTSDGGYLSAGMKYDYFTGIYAGFLLKINALGNVVWYSEYNSPDNFHFIDMKKLSNGNLLLLGYDDNSSQEVIIVTDPNGTVLSSHILDVAGYNTIYQNFAGLDINSSDALLLTYSNLDNITYNTNTFLFYSPNPNFTWCNAANFPVTESIISYVPTIGSGAFVQPISLSASSLAAPQSCSVLISDYCTNSGISDPSVQQETNLFPNPFSSTATIEIDASMIDNSTVFVMYDLLGKEVKTAAITNPKTEIEKGNLPVGIYTYKIISDKGIIGKGKVVLAD